MSNSTMVVPLKYKLEHAGIDQAFKAYTRRLKYGNAVLINFETNSRRYRVACNLPEWLKKIIKLENFMIEEQINIMKDKRMFTVVSQHTLPVVKANFVSTVSFLEDESKSTVVFGNVRIKNIPTALKTLANQKMVKWIETNFMRDRKQEANYIHET